MTIRRKFGKCLLNASTSSKLRIPSTMTIFDPASLILGTHSSATTPGPFSSRSSKHKHAKIFWRWLQSSSFSLFSYLVSHHNRAIAYFLNQLSNRGFSSSWHSSHTDHNFVSHTPTLLVQTCSPTPRLRI